MQVSTQSSKLLLVQVAALGWDFLQRNKSTDDGLNWSPLTPVFPALTCTVQATLRTGLDANEHGMIANGLYLRNLRKPMFWEQSSALVSGERIWKHFRENGKSVGLMFWQQSLGEQVDLVLSPKPIHTHGGGLVQDCYSQPHDLYAQICADLGRRFDLKRYWGPMASHVVGDWIVDATAWVMQSKEQAPDFLCTYLPSLDYDLQRYGPDSHQAKRALDATMKQIGKLVHLSSQLGYDVVVVGDYAIQGGSGGVAFPNQALLQHGLFATRNVKGCSYPDFHTSRSFAMVDHEIAHVYVQDGASLGPTKELLGSLPEVEEVNHGEDRPTLHHPNCGELVLVAKPGCWFAYPWWKERNNAPDYAKHIDIHNKPGYDPCELFWGWPPLTVSQDVSKIRGSHGRVGEGRNVAWASTTELGGTPTSQVDLARFLQQRLCP